MERAPETTSKGSDPVKVFAVLAVILVVVGVVFWLTRPDSAALPGPLEAQPLPETDFSLTDAEAIARFKELDELRLQALRTRDATLLRLVFAPHGPAQERVQQSISELKSNAVLFRSKYETSKVEVVRNSPTRIKILQTVLVEPRFVDEAGNDVTGNRFVERQKSEWVLLLVEDEWLIHRGTIVRATQLSFLQ